MGLGKHLFRLEVGRIRHSNESLASVRDYLAWITRNRRSLVVVDDGNDLRSRGDSIALLLRRRSMSRTDS